MASRDLATDVALSRHAGARRYSSGFPDSIVLVRNAAWPPPPPLFAQAAVRRRQVTGSPSRRARTRLGRVEEQRGQRRSNASGRPEQTSPLACRDLQPPGDNSGRVCARTRSSSIDPSTRAEREATSWEPGTGVKGEASGQATVPAVARAENRRNLTSTCCVPSELLLRASGHFRQL